MSTFLIVDDSNLMKVMLRKILVSAGHTIIGEASNGQQAFEEYKRLRPEIVTMDITMKGVDGIQGLKMIREYDPNAIVIMCSAMAQQWLTIEAIQAGAKGFIIKPFTQEQVLSTLADVTRKL